MRQGFLHTLHYPQISNNRFRNITLEWKSRSWVLKEGIRHGFNQQCAMFASRIALPTALLCLSVGILSALPNSPSPRSNPVLKEPLYTNPKAAVEARVADLLGRMTLAEKLSLLALEAGDPQRLKTLPIPRLGVPPLWTSDGPNGVRSGQSTVFPMGVTLASTWNIALAQQEGEALAQEALAKNRQVVYGPNLNIHRTPQGGRNFESFSEDPFLTAQMGVAYVRGMQSLGVAACIKHYVCNDQETGRHSITVVVGPRALHEIYLMPFQAAVTQGHAWSLMDALGRVNGPWVASNPGLLTDTLKKGWGFDGLVISDWGSVHDTAEAANAGNDIEMPSPHFFSPVNLQAALKNGTVKQSVIDDKVRRLIRLMVRTNLLNGPIIADAAQINSPAHQALARRIAQQGIVLLKNRGNLLPLDRAKIKTIAVIGPNAAVNQLGGRWSADVTPFTSVSILDGIRTKVAGKITVNYVEGTPLGGDILTPIPASAFSPTDAKPGETGLRAKYFADMDLSGTPALTRIDPQIAFDWNSLPPAPSLSREHFSTRWTGLMKPPTTGDYTLMLDSDDGSRLYLDDKIVIDYWSGHGMGTPKIAHLALTAGKSYQIRVEQYQGNGGAGCTLGWVLPGAVQDVFPEAVAAAKSADIAIVVVGTSNTIEGEELDPPDLLLPGNQNALIRAVAAVNKNTVVVLANGTPILLNSWLPQVPALLESWYSGEQAGNAIADILFGDVNPSGKLTDTLAIRREDYSDYGNYPGTADTVTYAEGIYVGYRHFDKQKIAPLYPFGYGLSYTTFAYSALHVPTHMKRGLPITAVVTVQNTGKRAGEEVVQLYVHDKSPKIDRPVIELKGFQRVLLHPNEKKRLVFQIDESAMAYYDTALGHWKTNSGRYAVEIGSSSRDIRTQAEFTLK